MEQVLLNIFRPKCQHAQELRTFKVFSADTTFEKLEGRLLCHTGGLMEVSLASNEDGPWTKLDDGVDGSLDLYQAPVGLLIKQFPGTKYVKLKCITPEEHKHIVPENPACECSEKRNAFDILMKASSQVDVDLPQRKLSSSGVRDGLSRKDELYNRVIDWMEERGMTLRNPHTEGSYITQIHGVQSEVLTNALWYVTNQHEVINNRSQREGAVKPIPTAFEDFQGFNDHRRKKLKAQPLESSQLKTHAETLLNLCAKPVMQSTPAWQIAYKDIKSLAESFLSYYDYLLTQREKVDKNQKLIHPVRQVSENISVWTVHKSSNDIRPQYILLDKAMGLADFHEPVFFDESKHLSTRFQDGMQRLRFFENIQLSVTVDIFKYCPGGGVTTIYCLTKVTELRSEAEKFTQVASAMNKIKPKFPEYHTRQMKRMFREKVSNICSIRPSVADLLYKELTLDASTSDSTETQQRLHLIFMGETGLLADYRKMNKGRPGNTFDTFFSRMAEVVEEYTAADDRRHSVAHMSEILSVKDLIKQTMERCPENTNIPSAALVRLQFTPRNPYAHTALNFTSKIQVQYKIQRRQLRLSHKDDHYCNALLKYLRFMAVKFRDECQLFFCDDKAKIPVGEPNCPISTGVRGKKTLAPVTTTLVATDHDLHHKGSLTPSVSLRCAIPEDAGQSFYRGKVTTTINDSVFQASNPLRHAAALVKQVRESDSNPHILLKYSDGGTDHRNTLESVKCAAICVFKELNLDMYIAARCSPGNSWINPCERVMSILNIGLQNCTLSRKECTVEIEKVLKRCTSMDDIRKAAKSNHSVQDAWSSSVENAQQMIEKRFRRLALKDEPVEVMSPIPENEIDYLTRHLNYLFPDLDTSKLVKSHTSKVPAYQDWLEKHCRQRQYVFQIKKCNDPGCCLAPTCHAEWLPDPMLDESGDHYKHFEAVYGKETSEADRPSLATPEVQKEKKGKPQKPSGSKVQTNSLNNLIPADPALKGEAAVFTAQHARLTITCNECSKQRVIYSKIKFSMREEVLIAMLLSEYEYSCGAPLTPPGHALHGKAFVRLAMECSSPMETSYYSANIGEKNVCYYCGNKEAEADAELKQNYKTVLPICPVCREKGLREPCFLPYGKKSKKT